jgi:hypothetical protein
LEKDGVILHMKGEDTRAGGSIIWSFLTHASSKAEVLLLLAVFGF